jgi:CRP-like cAMP-binding protein
MNPEQVNLSRWRLFADMTSADVDVVLAASESRVLVAGEELFHENDAGDSLWIVRGGRVEIFKAIRGDVDRVLASLSPGDVIGELSFVDGSRRSAGARTAEASEFAVLSRGAFEKVHRERPEVAAVFYRNLAAIMASRLRTTNELYREAVIYGMEATGAAALKLADIVEELRPTTVHLSGGTAITGRLLQMDHNAAGYTLVIKADGSGRLTIVPYHAIQRIDVT